MAIPNPTPQRAARLAGVLVLGTLLLTSACDLSVTNPGPIQSDALNTPGAIPGLVNGMSGDLSYALGNYADRGALFSGELVHAGNYPVEEAYFQGVIKPTDVNNDWASMQRARWVAEHGLERMQTVLGDGFESDSNTPRAYLYAGFADRLLGENVCTGIIDSGPPQTDSVYFQRADSLFTRAYQVATAQGNTTVARAALGGRASVRAWLGDWTGAVTDAASVPPSFEFDAVFSLNTTRENNDMANQTVNRRESTVYGTVFADDPTDPRTPWDTVFTGSGEVQTGQDGRTPFFRQAKYTRLDDGIPLTKGTEMLLLRAEAALRSGDAVQAMALVNEERAQYGLDETAAADQAEAWSVLQRERAAVVWLEARHLWDERRWAAEGRSDFFADGRSRCIPPSAEEQGSNPNL